MKGKKKVEESDEVEAKEYELAEDGNIISFQNFYINYARFHSDKTNIWIHLIGVPLIGLS